MSTKSENNNEIDLKEVFAVLRERRKSIIYGVLISFSVFVGILLLVPKTYESVAVLSLGDISVGIDIPTFRSMESVYTNTNLFENHIAGAEAGSDWYIFDEFFSNNIEPIYGYGMKSAVGIDRNPVLGLKVTCEGPTTDMAKDRVVLLGGYLETVILNNWIWEYVNLERGKAEVNIARNNNAILQAKFEIENLKEKADLLENDFLGTVALRSAFVAQIVQVDEVTEKYLSPKQQLVSVRVSIKNNEIKVKGLNRKLRMDQALLDYLARLEQFFDDDMQFLYDVKLLDKLHAEKDKFFADQAKGKAIKEVYFMVGEQLNTFFNLRYAEYKFVSGPTINSESVKPELMLLSVLALLIFTMSFVGRALFLNWWTS